MGCRPLFNLSASSGTGTHSGARVVPVGDNPPASSLFRPNPTAGHPPPARYSPTRR